MDSTSLESVARMLGGILSLDWTTLEIDFKTFMKVFNGNNSLYGPERWLKARPSEDGKVWMSWTRSCFLGGMQGEATRVGGT